MTALDGGAGYVVGWDNDLGALDIAFARSREAGTRFTPLYGDACDPTPNKATRRALHHLSYSCAPLFGPAILVTHDP
jgi:hypothetical protein